MVLDAQQSSYFDNLVKLRYDNTCQAIGLTSFVPTIAGGVAQIDVLQLWKVGSPTGNVWVDIYTDSSTLPVTKVGSSSTVIDVSSLATSGNTSVSFVWSTGYPPVSIGVTYWIVLQGDFTISTSHYVTAHYSSYAHEPDYVVDRLNAGVWQGYDNGRGSFQEWVNPTSGALFFSQI
jgi:hypothetical protein